MGWPPKGENRKANYDMPHLQTAIHIIRQDPGARVPGVPDKETAERMEEMKETVTQELDRVIAENDGRVRDALNVTLAKLHISEHNLAEAQAEIIRLQAIIESNKPKRPDYGESKPYVSVGGEVEVFYE